MKTTTHEITPGIHRISTFVPDAGPQGLSFNQFLIVADQPLLFHTGPRGMFPLTSKAIASILPLEKLRWIAFGHVESDECGAMNEFLAAAPDAQVVHGAIGCMVQLNDLCDRPPRVLENGQVLDLGGKRVRYIDTPHVPHNWEACVLFEETSRTLLCGDLLAQGGDGPPVTTNDVLAAALGMEEAMHPSAMAPATVPTLRKLAQLEPKWLATMHGSTFEGDGAKVLGKLADGYDGMIAASVKANA